MFLDWERHRLIHSDRQQRRAGILSLAEILLIMVLFHTPIMDKDARARRQYLSRDAPCGDK